VLPGLEFLIAGEEPTNLLERAARAMVSMAA
jgi:hypothetical protein